MLMCDFALSSETSLSPSHLLPRHCSLLLLLLLLFTLLLGGQACNELNLSVIRPEPREFQSITISVG